MLSRLTLPSPKAGLDLPYLDKVRDGFNSIGVSSELALYVFYVVLTAAMVGVLGLVARRIRGRLLPRDVPTGWILRRSEILNILGKALRDRSTFEMRFIPSDRARKSTHCAFVEFNKDVLRLELPGSVQVTRKWLERTVECFFRVIVNKRQTIHYALTSTIVGIEQPRKELFHLLLEFPQKLELYQKRAFLRVEPPSQYTLGCALWPESPDMDQDKRSNFRKWGKPSLTYLPGNADNPLLIQNISAGGVRVLVRRKAMRETGLTFEISRRFFLLMDLYEPSLEKKRRYWFLVRVQNSYEDFETRDREIGLQYLQRGTPHVEDSNLLTWSDVDADGVERMAGWVMKRHLELYRKTGFPT